MSDRVGMRPRATPARSGRENDQLEEKRERNRRDQRNDDDLESPKTVVLEIQDDEHIR